MTLKIVFVRLFYPAYTLEQMRTRRSKSPGDSSTESRQSD